MAQAGINFIKYYPEQFLEFLKANDYPVYHRSNIFFRDFQYGLWKFLNQNQTKVSYADMETMAHELIDAFKESGLVKQINRQSFQLNLAEFETVFPTAGFGPEAPPAPPAKAKPAAVAPAAASAAPKPAAPASDSSSAASSASATVALAAIAAMSPEEKAARIADVQRKIEEAKARRLAGG